MKVVECRDCKAVMVYRERELKKNPKCKTCGSKEIEIIVNP